MQPGVNILERRAVAGAVSIDEDRLVASSALPVEDVPGVEITVNQAGERSGCAQDPAHTRKRIDHSLDDWYHATHQPRGVALSYQVPCEIERGRRRPRDLRL